MQLEIETRGEKTETGWRDHDGFIGPVQPGTGPRSDPRGEFPTGPEIGQRMPDILCLTADGGDFDLHTHRAGHPAVFIFFRSAVW
jgi:hypothetical protein